jgi:hypothetical protein
MVDQPFFDVRIGREYTECSTWRARALERVVALRPDVAILGSSYAYEFTREQWLEGTARVLATLDGAVGRVYLLRATPILPFDGPNCLMRVGLQSSTAPRSCSASAASPRADDVFGWLTEAASRFPRVQVIDMNDVVCPQDRCEAERDGVVIFRDAQHLSADFADSLAGTLASRLALE